MGMESVSKTDSGQQHLVPRIGPLLTIRLSSFFEAGALWVRCEVASEVIPFLPTGILIFLKEKGNASGMGPHINRLI